MEIKDFVLAELEKRKLKGDIYIEDNKKTEITVNDEKIETIKQADSFGIGIRIFKDSKLGFGYATIKDEKEMISLIDSIENGCYIEGYESYELSKPESQKTSNPVKLADQNYKNITIQQKQEKAFELESAVKKYSDKIKFVRDTTFSGSYSRISYLNTNGVDTSYDATYNYMHTTAISSDGKEQQAVDGMDGDCLFSNLNPEKLGIESARRATGLLGGKSIKSGKYNIILPPHSGVDFLDLLSSLFLASNIRKGKSLLKDFKTGYDIASGLLNIKDDALLSNRIGSYPIDGEGEAGQSTDLIKNGKLASFLYDKNSAAFFKTKTTGNAVRSGYKTLPDCDTSNIYIPAGECSLDKIMKEGNGIIIDSMMGLHTADTVSGNFSLGVNGWLMEKGEIKHAVNEVLVSGNIKDLLKNITDICDDLKFYFSYGTPTLVIKDVQIAGK